MRFAFSIMLLTGLTGCGPLFIPMLPRLGPDDQRTVDQMWDNLLTPVQRVDREALLDANIAYWMFTIGVDRLHMKSEKYLSGGTAVMEIDCDRASPDTDQFTITVLDVRGRTVRRERYTRAEVEESSSMLRGLPNLGPTELLNIKGTVTVEIGRPTTQPASQRATEPATEASACTETPEERRFRRESKRRRLAAASATQPARLKSPAPARP